MEQIFDLPAHPLFVHAPVVLAPLVALGAIVWALRPGWRSRYRWHMLVGVAAVLASILLAVSSGDPFKDLVFPNTEGELPIEHHQDLALTTRMLTFVWFAVTLVAVGFAEWSRRATAAGPGNDGGARNVVIQHALAALVAVAGVVVTIWVIRTGHEGAKVTWEGVVL